MKQVWQGMEEAGAQNIHFEIDRKQEEKERTIGGEEEPEQVAQSGKTWVNETQVEPLRRSKTEQRKQMIASQKKKTEGIKSNLNRQ